MRSDTRTITIDVAPAEVFAFVADPANLPRYATGFAKAIRPDGAGWLVDVGGSEIALRAATNPALGTVDYYMTSPQGAESTVFTRVLPNGAGAEYVFTLFLPDSASDADVDSQAEVLAAELRVLKQLCQREAAGIGAG
jgi:hypothetical protein